MALGIPVRCDRRRIGLCCLFLLYAEIAIAGEQSITVGTFGCHLNLGKSTIQTCSLKEYEYASGAYGTVALMLLSSPSIPPSSEERFRSVYGVDSIKASEAYRIAYIIQITDQYQARGHIVAQKKKQVSTSGAV